MDNFARRRPFASCPQLARSPPAAGCEQVLLSTAYPPGSTALKAANGGCERRLPTCGRRADVNDTAPGPCRALGNRKYCGEAGGEALGLPLLGWPRLAIALPRAAGDGVTTLAWRCLRSGSRLLRTLRVVRTPALGDEWPDRPAGAQLARCRSAAAVIRLRACGRRASFDFGGTPPRTNGGSDAAANRQSSRGKRRAEGLRSPRIGDGLLVEGPDDARRARPDTHRSARRMPRRCGAANDRASRLSRPPSESPAHAWQPCTRAQIRC